MNKICALIWAFAALPALGGGFSGNIAAAATVVLSPGDNIQSAVNANPSGTAFVFNPGTYSMQNIIPKSGNVFDGQGGATLDGNNVTKTAFHGTASNVTIKNLTIQNYKSDLQNAAVDAEFGNAWTIQNNSIQLNYSVGVNFGNNTQVIGNNLSKNGEEGFSGGGGGWLMENNQISNNNTRLLDWGFEAGGGKVTQATSGVFRGNTAFGNNGPGIWLDIDADYILVENNTCASNLGPGIMVEISHDAIVRNNTCINNGESLVWTNASILISSSENNQVYGNVVDVSPNRLGIFAMSQGREYTAIHNDIHDNDVWLRGTQGGVEGVDRDDNAPVFTANDFHDNTYHVKNPSTKYFSWENDYTLSQAQSHSKETGSSLELMTGILGDYNLDGTVNAADYVVWRDALGSTTANRFDGADGNGDGIVDEADYVVWTSNFGQSIGTGAASNSTRVPEPRSEILFVFGTMILIVKVNRFGSAEAVRRKTCPNIETATIGNARLYQWNEFL